VPISLGTEGNSEIGIEIGTVRYRDMRKSGRDGEREGVRQTGRKKGRERETGRNRGGFGIPDSGNFACCPTRYKCI
jgi:hypothetical protein